MGVKSPHSPVSQVAFNMVRRLVATQLVALHLVLVCSWSSADSPLVSDELQVKRATAQADAQQAAAAHELAEWKLSQLLKMQSLGYASWQEIAEQKITVKSTAATAEAAAAYSQAVIDWQASTAQSDSQSQLDDCEFIHLYMPGSPRLVAAIPSDVANADVCERHLEQLRKDAESIAQIDLAALESAVAKAEREVAFRRGEDNADLLQGALLRLRLAEATLASSQARKAEGEILARRIAMVDADRDEPASELRKPSPAVAEIGTQFTDATNSHRLQQLAVAMASDSLAASKQLAWLELQRDIVAERIESISQLQNRLSSDEQQLEQAQQKKSDLEQQIAHAQDLLKLREQIAGNYQAAVTSPAEEEGEPATSNPLELASLADANVVRHFLYLRELKLEREAKLASAQAQHDYLIERRGRVQQIPKDARPPKELADLDHKIQTAELQMEILRADLALLQQEQQRYCRQVKSQRSGQYQLVQLDRGLFIGREQFEVAASLIAAVGLVGNAELTPATPKMFPYVESSTVLQCMMGGGVQPIGPIKPADQPEDSEGETQLTSFGWRLTTDGFAFSPDRFCYRPFSLRQEYLHYRWAATHQWRGDRLSWRRSFSAWEPYHYTYWWHSPQWYRVYRPARLGDCLGDRWTRAPYPSWSRIYAPAYSRVLDGYRGYGYGYPSRFGCGCFD